MSTSVFIIRHGAYDHRPSKEGSEAATDFGLSGLGRAQVQSLAARLAKSGEIKAEVLYCSTLPRAKETAELIAPVFNLVPRAIPELCEWESGNEIIGAETFIRKMRALAPHDRRHYRFHPSSETIAEFTQRVHAKLCELIEAHNGQSVVLVAHGGVIEAAFTYFLGYGPGPFVGGFLSVGHASITHWRHSDRRDAWALEYANDMHHLQSVRDTQPSPAQ